MTCQCQQPGAVCHAGTLPGPPFLVGGGDNKRHVGPPSLGHRAVSAAADTSPELPFRGADSPMLANIDSCDTAHVRGASAAVPTVPDTCRPHASGHLAYPGRPGNAPECTLTAANPSPVSYTTFVHEDFVRPFQGLSWRSGGPERPSLPSPAVEHPTFPVSVAMFANSWPTVGQRRRWSTVECALFANNSPTSTALASARLRHVGKQIANYSPTRRSSHGRSPTVRQRRRRPGPGSPTVCQQLANTLPRAAARDMLANCSPTIREHARPDDVNHVLAN